MFYCVGSSQCVLLGGELLVCFIGWGAHSVFYCVGEFLMCFIVWVSS